MGAFLAGVTEDGKNFMGRMFFEENGSDLVYELSQALCSRTMRVQLMKEGSEAKGVFRSRNSSSQPTICRKSHNGECGGNVSHTESNAICVHPLWLYKEELTKGFRQTQNKNVHKVCEASGVSAAGMWSEAAGETLKASSFHRLSSREGVNQNFMSMQTADDRTIGDNNAGDGSVILFEKELSSVNASRPKKPKETTNSGLCEDMCEGKDKARVMVRDDNVPGSSNDDGTNDEGMWTADELSVPPASCDGSEKIASVPNSDRSSSRNDYASLCDLSVDEEPHNEQ